MDKKTAYKGPLLLLLIFAAAGELAEIKTQNVAYGDSILQYALVRVEHPDGTFHRIVCPDCQCSITVYDSQYQKMVDNEPMALIEPQTGLYGYPVSSNILEYGKTYNTVIYVDSPTYGNGSTPSLIHITDKTALLADASPTSGGMADDIIAGVSDGIKTALSDALSYVNPLKILLPKKQYDGFIANLTWVFDSFIQSIVIVKNGMGSLLGSFAKILTVGIGLMFAETRDAALKDGLDALSGLSSALLAVFLPIIVVCELYIVHKAIQARDAGTQMEIFATENMKVLSAIFAWIRRGLDIIWEMINGIIGLLQTIAQAIPF